MLKDMTPIEELINGTLEKYGVPGLAVGIVSGNDLVYCKGFGRKDLNKEGAADGNTRFPNASVTKAMVATCLGILKDQGKLDWNVPIREYVPEIQFKDPMARDITLTDMLSHNSGLSRNDYSWVNFYPKDFSTEEYVKRIGYIEPDRPFRSGYEYNNFMYTLAGYIVEKLSGKPLKDFLKDNIFDPLGMKNSGCTLKGFRDAKNSALPYKRQFDKTVPSEYLSFDGMAGAGGTYSTLNDMAKWIACNINGGEFNGKRIISEKVMEEIKTPRTVVPETPEERCAAMPLCCYGFGWNVQPYRGHRMLNHSGGTDGYAIYLTYMPDEKLGIMLYCNLYASIYPFAIANEIYDHLLGEGDGTDWLKFYQKIRDKWHKDVKKENAKIIKKRSSAAPSRALKEYVGVYNNKGYGDFKIYLKKGELRLLYNGVDVALSPNNHDTFECVYEDIDPMKIYPVTFYGDSTGKVVKMCIPFEETLKEPLVFVRKEDEKKNNKKKKK